MNLNTKVEILWCFISGTLFSMLPRLFNSGGNEARQFDLSRWIKSDLDYFGRYGTLDEFLFAFIMRYRLISNSFLISCPV